MNTVAEHNANSASDSTTKSNASMDVTATTPTAALESTFAERDQAVFVELITNIMSGTLFDPRRYRTDVALAAIAAWGFQKANEFKGKSAVEAMKMAMDCIERINDYLDHPHRGTSVPTRHIRKIEIVTRQQQTSAVEPRFTVS